MSRHAPCTKESKSGVSERIPSYRGIMAKKKTRQKGPEGRRRKAGVYITRREIFRFVIRFVRFPSSLPRRRRFVSFFS